MGTSIMGVGSYAVLAFGFLAFCFSVWLCVALLFLPSSLSSLPFPPHSFFFVYVLFDYPLCFFVLTLYHTTRRLLGVENGYTKNG
jgi:hypothetical protein